ncbi:MAG: hypothetical protein JWN38_1177 [Candidatus Saccharibacteria bacterium]|nr:hypothetical protein [Candidatus Saccharibacteria bacterium]
MVNINTKNTNQNVKDFAHSLGLTVMTTAAVLSTIVLPEPVLAAVTAQETPREEGMTAQRREREESGPHYISYNTSQRTPSRSASL